MAQKSFRAVVSAFSGVPNMHIRLTMKSGRSVTLDEYTLTGNTLSAKNGHHASVDDIRYLEISSE